MKYTVHLKGSFLESITFPPHISLIRKSKYRYNETSQADPYQLKYGVLHLPST